MKGKISIFGGANDEGMAYTEGLALYESHEADMRPDLFNPRGIDPTQGTSKRLRDDALYFAYRFDFPHGNERAVLQLTPRILYNATKSLYVCVSLCDWGPAESTGRTFDISPRAAELLGVTTDDEIEMI